MVARMLIQMLMIVLGALIMFGVFVLPSIILISSVASALVRLLNRWTAFRSRPYAAFLVCWTFIAAIRLFCVWATRTTVSDGAAGDIFFGAPVVVEMMLIHPLMELLKTQSLEYPLRIVSAVCTSALWAWLLLRYNAAKARKRASYLMVPPAAVVEERG